MALSYRYSCAKRILLIDCHNVPESDCRLVSVMNALQDAINLNRRLAGSNWTHFGLTIIKNSKPDVLMRITHWNSIDTSTLVKVFKQTQESLLDEINSTCDIFSTSLRKDYLVKGIENAWKQIKEVKPKEALNEIVLITFNWENKGGMALKQLFGNELLKQDLSLSIQVIDLCCSVKFNATEEWLCVRSFQPLNFDLEVEAFFKSWITITRKEVKITFDDGNELCGRVGLLHVDSHVVASNSTPMIGTTLNAKATIAVRELSQGALRCSSQVLLPEPLTTNIPRWRAVWQHLMDLDLVLVVTSEQIQSGLLIPDQDCTLILQPFTDSLFDTQELEEPEVSLGSIPSLPLITEFGVGKPANLNL